MKKADSFREYVLEQLRDVPGISCRSMFGGHGLFKDERMFGIFFKARFYLKVSPRSKAAYVKAGMGPFMPSARMTLKSYYEVPGDVLEKPAELARWTAAAVRSAGSSARSD
jgi:DNA transformation protein and related proteins